MRVVFMGTPQIAADCLSRLIADGFDLVGVYTKPDMPKNRGMKLAMSEVKEVALAAGLGIWATGEEKLPTVTYYDGNDGNNARFVFTNTGKGSATDLFANFSNCMPGDSLTQTICVKADSANGAQGAKVYLRAEIDGDTSAKEGTAIKYDDVLSHIHMTVSQDGKVLATNKNASLFDQLDAADGLKSDVLVAEVFPKADPIKLDVTVEIDPAMGNAFQEAAAHIKFVFSAEDNELPPPPLERDNHDSYIAGYPDGTVAPGRPITRAEVAAIFYRILRDDGREEIWTTKCSYSDVPAQSWYTSQVATLTNGGILAGYKDGTFRPQQYITRAEFATIAALFFHAPEVEDDAFTDISDSWARDYINRAAKLGLVSGYEDGTFCPQNQITRAEVMEIINNVLFRTPDKDHLLPDMIVWPDNSNKTAWYYAAVQEATNGHEYERVDNTSPETWTELRPPRDWDALEAELTQKYPDR